MAVIFMKNDWIICRLLAYADFGGRNAVIILAFE